MTTTATTYLYRYNSPDAFNDPSPLMVDGNQPSLAERFQTEEKQSYIEAISDALFVLCSSGRQIQANHS